MRALAQDGRCSAARLRVLHRSGMSKRSKGEAGQLSVVAIPGRADWHGRAEAAAWLDALGLRPVPRWHIEVVLDAGPSTKLALNIYAEEWGFAFHHARRSSWIRVTDIAFVHGRDDFGLITRMPPLLALGMFAANLETEYDIELARSRAIIRSNLSGATSVVRRWLRESPVEPCGNEMHDGIRCTRAKGHDGHHAYETREGALRWKPTS